MSEDTKTSKKTLQVSPNEEASLQEWREWALELEHRLSELTIKEKERIRQLRILRKDVKGKDKALGRYKKNIQILEEKIERNEKIIRDFESKSQKRYLYKKWKQVVQRIWKS